MADNSGQMSHKKLTMLIGLLGVIWVLCYNAEKQLPTRHIMDTYDRIQGRNISQKSLQLSVQILKKQLGAFQKQKNYFTQQYSIKTFIQKPICVILSEDKKQDGQSLSMLKSIFQQEYSNYKVYYMYSESALNSLNAINFINQNALDQQKLKTIATEPGQPIFDHFLEGQRHCQENSIVLYLNVNDTIIGNSVFDLINTHFSKDQSLQLLYSASLIQGQNKQNYRLSYSYPYPQDIIDNSQYRNYPFIMGGVVAFKQSLYTKVHKPDLISSSGQYYKQLKSIVFGIRLLQLSNRAIKYIQQPLLLDNQQEIYVTNNKKMKTQIKQLYETVNVIL